MSSKSSIAADAPPAGSSLTSIAETLQAARRRAGELFARQRASFAAAASSRQNDVDTAAPAIEVLLEEIEERRRQWLEIQDNVCRQHEDFWREFEQREESLRREPAESESSDDAELAAELESWRNRCRQSEEEVLQLHEQIETLQSQLRSGDVDCEQALENAESLAELHDLREANARLEKQIRKLQNQSSGSSHFDWEKHKQQMLDQLDGADSAEEESEQYYSAEADRLVQERDVEIERLQKKIREQEETLKERIVAPLDGDPGGVEDRVAEERAKLESLQDEWREMLRKAEIEISIERAKLARDKKKLEDEVGNYKDEIDRLKKDVDNLQAGRETSRGGNWLSRLGLGGKGG